MTKTKADEYTELPLKLLNSWSLFFSDGTVLEKHIVERNWLEVADPFKLSAILFGIILISDRVFHIHFWNIVQNDDIKLVIFFISANIILLNILVWPFCSDKSAKSFWSSCISCLRGLSFTIFFTQIFIILMNILMEFFSFNGKIGWVIFVILSLFYVGHYLRIGQLLFTIISLERNGGVDLYSAKEIEEHSATAFWFFLIQILACLYFIFPSSFDAYIKNPAINLANYVQEKAEP